MTHPGGSPSTVPAPAAGWYRDPWRDDALRWWDGRGWTGHVAVRRGPEPAPVEASPPPSGWVPDPEDPTRLRWVAEGGWTDRVAIPGEAVPPVGVVAATVAGVVPLVALLTASTVADRVLGASLVVTVLAGFLVQPIALLGLPWWWARRRGTTLRRFAGLSFRWSDVPRGVVAGVTCRLITLPLVVVVVAVAEDLMGSNVDVDDGSDPLDVSRGTAIALAVGLAVIMAPLVEETLVRGIVLPAYAARWGAGWGIAWSSLLFGSLHIVPALGRGNVGLVLALSLSGAVFAHEAHRTGRLGSAIVAHAVANGIVVALLVADAV